jgi:hypothetical protein
MSDDLIKRLEQYCKPGRGDDHPQAVDCREAADRIEQLERERKQNGEDYCALMEKHDALHVKLAKAVEALRFYAYGHTTPPTGHRAHTTLAELES